MATRCIGKLLAAVPIILALLAICYQLQNLRRLDPRVLATRSAASAVDTPDDYGINLHNLTYAGADDGDSPAWEAALKRGCMLLECMKSPSTCSQTEWKFYSQLAEWGWYDTTDAYDNKQGTLDSLVSAVAEPLKELHMYPWVGDTEIRKLQSDKEFKLDGVTYAPSKGQYRNMFSPNAGFIIAYVNYSPDTRHTSSLDPALLPYLSPPDPGEQSSGPPTTKLTHWSDVVYLVWASLTTMQQRKNLRHVLRTNVHNPVTREITELALEKAQVAERGRVPAWPGYTFTPTDPDSSLFRAMLGTPNVLGVAWLLIQHAGGEELGHKTIESIRVWGPAEGTWGFDLAMLITIGEA